MISTINFTMERLLESSKEDAPPYSQNNLFIICDGLGGTGATPHFINGDKYTSAYIASRLISKFSINFFEGIEDEIADLNQDQLNQIIEEFKNDLKKYLEDKIKEFNLSLPGESRAKSLHLLPSTLALGIFKIEEEKVKVLVIWSGDSRVYLLSPNKGLRQLSIDDVDGNFEAMENLGVSSMNNCVYGDKDFHINWARYEFEIEPGMMLFACSDGVFDFLQSPVQIEWVIEQAAVNNNSNEPVSIIGDLIGQYYTGKRQGDDTTLAGVIFNTETISQFIEFYKDRIQYINENFYFPLTQQLQKVNEAKKRLSTSSLEFNTARRTFKDNFSKFIQSLYASPRSKQQLIDIMKIVGSLPYGSSFILKEKTPEEMQIQLEKFNELRKKSEILKDQLKNNFITERFNYYLKELRSNPPREDEYRQVTIHGWSRKKPEPPRELKLLRAYDAHTNEINKIKKTSPLIENLSFLIKEALKIAPDHKINDKEINQLAQMLMNYKTFHEHGLDDLVRLLREQQLSFEAKNELYNLQQERLELEFLQAINTDFQAYRTLPLSASFKKTLETLKQYNEIQEEFDNFKLEDTNLPTSYQMSRRILNADAELFSAIAKEEQLIPLLNTQTLESANSLKEILEDRIHDNETVANFINWKKENWRQFKENYELYHLASERGRV